MNGTMKRENFERFEIENEIVSENCKLSGFSMAAVAGGILLGDFAAASPVFPGQPQKITGTHKEHGALDHGDPGRQTAGEQGAAHHHDAEAAPHAQIQGDAPEEAPLAAVGHGYDGVGSGGNGGQYRIG